jgi:hypothetical protein
VRWLVSDNPTAPADATATANADDALVSHGKDAATSVRVPKVKVSGGTYACWVEDVGLKSDLGWSEGKFTGNERKQAARLSAAPGPDMAWEPRKGTQRGRHASGDECNTHQGLLRGLDGFIKSCVVFPQDINVVHPNIPELGGFLPFVIKDSEGRTGLQTRLFVPPRGRKMVLIVPPTKMGEKLAVLFLPQIVPPPLPESIR